MQVRLDVGQLLCQVDGDHHRRSRLTEALGVHRVEVAAEHQDQIGVVPQLPGGRGVRRQRDQHRVVRWHQAAPSVGGEHRRAELLGQRRHQRPGVGGSRPAADPDQRTYARSKH